MFLAAVYNEFIKIAAKPRSYLGLAAITLLVGVILFALKADGESYLSFITGSFEQTLTFNGKILNSSLVTFIILQMLIIHIPLLIALVTADLISGESAMGTLRMLATKPISRTGIVLTKFVAGAIYTLVVLLWLAFMALVVSKWLFGTGDLMVLNSDGIIVIQEHDVLWRYLAGFAVAYLALLTVAALSIMLSCFADNTIGPIVITMSIIILFTIIGTLDVSVFDPIKPYLFTTHMASWRSFFNDPLHLDDIKNSVLIMLAHITVFVGVAVYYFNKKDITS